MSRYVNQRLIDYYLRRNFNLSDAQIEAMSKLLRNAARRTTSVSSPYSKYISGWTNMMHMHVAKALVKKGLLIVRDRKLNKYVSPYAADNLFKADKQTLETRYAVQINMHFYADLIKEVRIS